MYQVCRLTRLIFLKQARGTRVGFEVYLFLRHFGAWRAKHATLRSRPAYALATSAALPIDLALYYGLSLTNPNKTRSVLPVVFHCCYVVCVCLFVCAY